MISTKTLILSIDDIPTQWLFEYYLNLPEKLEGQDIKILSPISMTDTIPSLSIYWHQRDNKYLFTDFSSGSKGNGVMLLAKMRNISYGEACSIAVDDYTKYLLINGKSHVKEYRENQKYQVSSYITREWNKLDERYWMQYFIGSKRLEQYKVIPLINYTLSKEESGESKKITIEGNYLYGYFRLDGTTLYKIYQPTIRDNKFIKVRDYIHGTDQLKYIKDYLVITSSLKDLMCLEDFNLNLETVAPDSENTLIKEHMIMAYKHKYKEIVCLFDVDEAGIKAMKKYKDRYGIESVQLNLEKDLSDSIAKYGQKEVKKQLFPLLTEKLKSKQTA